MNLGPAITSSEGTPNVSTNKVDAIMHSKAGVDKSVEADTSEETSEEEIGDDDPTPTLTSVGLALGRPLDTSNNTNKERPLKISKTSNMAPIIPSSTTRSLRMFPTNGMKCVVS